MLGPKLSLKGKFTLEIFDKDEKLKGKYEAINGVTDVGMNAMLDVVFHSGSQVTTWYIGLIDNASFTALAAADTMSSHSGWIEATIYSESVRQTWGAGAASSRVTTNSAQATFSINSSGTLKGVFLTSVSTKSGTTGTLHSTAAFGSNITVTNGDSVKITYTVSG